MHACMLIVEAHSSDIEVTLRFRNHSRSLNLSELHRQINNNSWASNSTWCSIIIII